MVVCDITKFWCETGGGIRRFLTEKHRYLKQYSQNRYILIIPGHKDSVEENGNVCVYRLKSFRFPFDKSYRLLLRPWAIRKIIRRERPDIVDVSSHLLVPWMALWGSRGLETRFVSSLHSNYVESYVRPVAKKLGRKMEEWLCRWAWRYFIFLHQKFAKILVVSEQVGRPLQERYPSKVVVIPLGVDPEIFHPKNRSEASRKLLTGGVTGDRVALYVGRLSHEKGIDLLLDLAPWMYEKFHIRLAVCGDGPFRKRMEQAARRPEITYLGFIGDPEQLSSLYASSDFLIVPGTTETFGLAAVEAMASGIPVMVPSGTGSEQFASGGAGITFDVGDQSDWTRALETMVRDCKTMGLKARERACAEYSWRETFETILKQYQALVPERS